MNKMNAPLKYNSLGNGHNLTNFSSILDEFIGTTLLSNARVKYRIDDGYHDCRLNMSDCE